MLDAEERKWYHVRAGTYLQASARAHGTPAWQADCTTGARPSTPPAPPCLFQVQLQANEGSVEGRVELRNLTGVADHWHAAAEWGSRNSNNLSLGWRQPLAVCLRGRLLTVRGAMLVGLAHGSP